MKHHFMSKKVYVSFLWLVLALVFALPVQALPKTKQPVEYLPFIFTPGTHGTLLVNDVPISGNITLAADHLHGVNYVLNSPAIPDVQADTDWLFRGWKVYTVTGNTHRFRGLFNEVHPSSLVANPVDRASKEKQNREGKTELVLKEEAALTVTNEDSEKAGREEDTAEGTTDSRTLEDLIEEVEIITRENMNETLSQYLDTPDPDIVYSSDVLQFLKLPYKKDCVYLASPYYQYIPKTPQSLLIRHQLDSQVHAGHLIPVPATGEMASVLQKRTPVRLLMVIILFWGALCYLRLRMKQSV